MVFQLDSKRLELNDRDLISLGFAAENGRFHRRFMIMSDTLFLDVFVDQTIETCVIDPDTNELYNLYKLKTLPSGYAYQVKMAVEEVLERLFQPFFIKNDNFPSKQLAFLEREMIAQFGEATDCPFQEDIARAFRLSSNRKWYGLAIMVNARKLGLGVDEEIPVINLRGPKGRASELVDNEMIFTAYHMHKKNWITIPLDYKAGDDQLLGLVLASREYVLNGR